MSRNAAAAAHSPAALDRVQVTTEANWSDKPLLACGPTATPAERAHSKSDVGSANGAEQAGSSASKQHQQASVGAGPATLEGGCIANSKAVATLHCRTDQPWKQVATRCSPHPTAHDTVYGVATPAAAPPSAICQGKAPVACASLASMSTSTSVTCHQDNSTVVHTASTSSCSSCTNADSVGSNACSTAHHDEANANLSQRLQAPQSKEKTASSEATDVHLAKEEQASAPSQKGPMTCQVFTAPPLFRVVMRQHHMRLAKTECNVMACRVRLSHKKQILPAILHVCKRYRQRTGTNVLAGLPVCTESESHVLVASIVAFTSLQGCTHKSCYRTIL